VLRFNFCYPLLRCLKFALRRAATTGGQHHRQNQACPHPSHGRHRRSQPNEVSGRSGSVRG
jgi:hypothetical protein